MTGVKDKIYIHRTYHLGLLSGSEIPVGAPEEDEYIRKEALLEWLKFERKKCESRDTELWQRLNAFTDVIEKVKSM